MWESERDEVFSFSLFASSFESTPSEQYHTCQIGEAGPDQRFLLTLQTIPQTLLQPDQPTHSQSIHSTQLYMLSLVEEEGEVEDQSEGYRVREEEVT